MDAKNIDELQLSIKTIEDSIKDGIKELKREYVIHSKMSFETKMCPATSIVDVSDVTSKLNLQMLDNNELLKLYSRIMNKNVILREILNHELKTYKLDLSKLVDIDSLDKYVKFVAVLLKRYQPYVCDVFDDNEWIVDVDSYMEKKENTTYLLNTIKTSDQWDKTLLKFLENFTAFCNRATDKFETSYSVANEDDACWIILQITNKIDL